MDAGHLIYDLLIVLAAGFIAGAACRSMGVSLLVGYLVVGAVIGEGVLGLVSQEHRELEYIARGGALLLLFSIGIEFSLDELVRLRRFIFLGGAVQMLAVGLPLTGVCLLLGLTWKAALLAAFAAALSSTVLVFKALTELGQAATPHGRRAVGILLFQDAALVPLMLLVPLLTGAGDPPSAADYGILAGKALLFVLATLTLRRTIGWGIVPLLARMRSVELVVLFTLTTLGGVCFGAHAIGLPPAVGALAAGLVLSGNRLSKQIDTLILPYRESFAAVFFVTLGTLLKPAAFLEEPVLLTAGLLGMLLLKSVAAAGALRLVGLNWRAALGMGMGLAQLGEFSFLLIAEGASRGVITAEDYNRLLFIALGTLILTPQILRFGLRRAGDALESVEPRTETGETRSPIDRAIVVGAGPIGRQVTSRLETLGVSVCLVDLSPINLHPFAQQGFQTVSGDGRDPDVLTRAEVQLCKLAIVCVPNDEAAQQVVRTLRELNGDAAIFARCRYLASGAAAVKAGASDVVIEEKEASQALLALCEAAVARSDAADRGQLPAS